MDSTWVETDVNCQVNLGDVLGVLCSGVDLSGWCQHSLTLWLLVTRVQQELQQMNGGKGEGEAPLLHC